MESRTASGHGEHGQRQTANHEVPGVSPTEFGRLAGLMESILHELREFKSRAIWRMDDLEARVELLEHRTDPSDTILELKTKVETLTEYQNMRKVPNRWMDRIITSVAAGLVMLVLTNLDWLVKVFS